MQKLGRALLVLAGGLLSGLALVASAAGTNSTQSPTVRHLQQQVGALAVDGNRVAYDLSARNSTNPHATNRVLVWNVRTGKTVKVSGRKTAVSDGVGGNGVFQLAIAGTRVAWLLNEGGNLESEDYLFTSSVTSPKERKVASALRTGDSCAPGRVATHCAGPWLGGLVGSGKLIALNRWATDTQGAAVSGGLYALQGTKLSSIASGLGTLLAVAADGGRVAVLHSDGTVSLYSATGSVLLTVHPSSAEAVALSGKNLLVLSNTRKLAVYDAKTGSLQKTLSVPGKGPQNLDVQGNIAIYTTGSSVHALNLTTGKDRAVGTLPDRIAFARIDGAGLAYAANGTRKSFGTGTLAFVPYAQVAAAVG
jgi:putative pyrroloquinoline-quinone binding quinoprotein